MSMPRQLRIMLARILLSRWSIVAFNVLTAMPLTLSLFEIGSLLWGTGLGRHESIAEAGHIAEGMGVVLIGWGVVLEERPGVSHLLGGLPSEDADYETALDAVCHQSGLGFLVLGLLAEILIQCVEVPDHIINTDGIERVVMTGSAGILLLGLALLLRHTISLVFFKTSRAVVFPASR